MKRVFFFFRNWVDNKIPKRNKWEIIVNTFSLHSGSESDAKRKKEAAILGSDFGGQQR